MTLQISEQNSNMCADLRTEILGLGKVIDGYLVLERSFLDELYSTDC